MTGKLDGKVALITYGASNQGVAQVRLFVAEGALVCIADVLDKQGDALAAELGDRVFYQHLDVGREEGWSDAVQAVLARWGRIDILVNGGGTNHTGLMEDTSVADFLRLVDTNQLGPWLGMRSMIGPMAAGGGGAIVNLISASVKGGLVGKTAYAGTKCALEGMSRIAARELGRHGIRVNSVLPGGIAAQGMTGGLPTTPEALAQFSELPIPRIGEADEVARAVLFLASDDASYCTGAELLVDGGLMSAPGRSPLPQHEVALPAGGTTPV
jgi:3alpha(or 20beta)-hydroxysteroid dehydrogenase